MQRIKLIAALLLTVMIIIVVLQNTAPVQTRLLFVTLEMPRAALLAFTLLVGIAIGMLMALGLSSRRRPPRGDQE